MLQMKMNEAVASLRNSSLQEASKNFQISTSLNEHSDFIGIDEACIILRLSKSSVYIKTHRRELPHYKQGKFLVFSRIELIEFLKKGRVRVESFADLSTLQESFRIEKIANRK